MKTFIQVGPGLLEESLSSEFTVFSQNCSKFNFLFILKNVHLFLSKYCKWYHYSTGFK